MARIAPCAEVTKGSILTQPDEQTGRYVEKCHQQRGRHGALVLQITPQLNRPTADYYFLSALQAMEPFVEATICLVRKARSRQ
jgi:hypothetical protein